MIHISRQKITTELNKMKLNSFSSFFNINGRFHNFIKDCYFLRYIGYDNEISYIAEIKKYDIEMTLRKDKQHAGYYRVENLTNNIPPEDVVLYSMIYSRYKEEHILNNQFQFQEPILNDTLLDGIDTILKLFQESVLSMTDSILRNFMIKLFFWIDTYLPHIFSNFSQITTVLKFVCSGKIKIQEYLFLYLLTLLGCDVLYLNPEEDLVLPDVLKPLSQVIIKSKNGQLALPFYDPCEIRKEESFAAKEEPSITNTKTSKSDSCNQLTCQETNVFVLPSVSSDPRSRKPLSYEELAQLASSVVMIHIYNENNECFKTGSGVIIGSQGYILTNYHVACNACYYSIRIEEEDAAYETSALLKYNQMFDLAIIRIDRTCKPIPVFQGNTELARGQKIVAIGSPLGLFNSVSDGIISGFREFEYVAMIQFTAPTSHGSSGGALLNLNGELIGLITGGFDDGQNLNLAVDYKAIASFASGFLS